MSEKLQEIADQILGAQDEAFNLLRSNLLADIETKKNFEKEIAAKEKSISSNYQEQNNNLKSTESLLQAKEKEVTSKLTDFGIAEKYRSLYSGMPKISSNLGPDATDSQQLDLKSALSNLEKAKKQADQNAQEFLSLHSALSVNRGEINSARTGATIFFSLTVLVFVSLLVAIGFFTVTWGIPQIQISSLTSQIHDAENQKDWDKVISLSSDLIDKTSRDQSAQSVASQIKANALNQLGLKLMVDKNYNGAAESFKTASTIYTDSTKRAEYLANQAEAYYQLGLKLMADKNYDGAAGSFEQAMKTSTNSTKNTEYSANKAEAYYQLGLKLMADKKYEDAAKNFDLVSTIVTDTAKKAQYISNVGDAYFGAKIYDKAIENYKKALSLNGTLAQSINPNLFTAYLTLANQQLDQNNYGTDLATNLNAAADLGSTLSNANKATLADTFNKAGKKAFDLYYMDVPEQYFNKAISLNPKAEYYANLATFYNYYGTIGREGFYNKALDTSSQAINLDPNSALGYSIRGIIISNLSKTDEAIADLNKAIQLDPGSVIAHRRLGSVYLNSQPDKAYQEITKAIELDPKDSNSYRIRAKYYRLKGTYDAAIQDLNQAINLNPRNADAYSERGLVNQYNKKDLNSALTDFQKAIQIYDKDPYFFINMGDVNNALGNYKEAINSANSAFYLNSKDVEIYWIVGFANLHLSDYSSSIYTFTKYIDNGGSNLTDAYAYICAAENNTKDYNSALTHCKKAIELDPKNGYAYYGRGVVQRNLGNRPEALKDFQKAVDLGYTDAKAELSK